MIDATLLQMTQSITAPLCFASICSLLVGLFWAIGVAGRDGMLRLKRLHQIPCSRCLYFTGDHRLKCTVHPCKALTEEAIDCRDYELTCHRLVTTRSAIVKKYPSGDYQEPINLPIIGRRESILSSFQNEESANGDT